MVLQMVIDDGDSTRIRRTELFNPVNVQVGPILGESLTLRKGNSNRLRARRLRHEGTLELLWLKNFCRACARRRDWLTLGFRLAPIPFRQLAVLLLTIII